MFSAAEETLQKSRKRQRGLAEGKELPEPRARGGEERREGRGGKGGGGRAMESLGLGLYPQAEETLKKRNDVTLTQKPSGSTWRMNWTGREVSLEDSVIEQKKI